MRVSLCALALAGVLFFPRSPAHSGIPDPCRPLRADTTQIAAFLHARCFESWPRDRQPIRKTGPTRGARAPHGKVRVWYAPQVYEWLKQGRPQGGIPDGSLIYKEMFDWDTEKPAGGAYMLKQSGSSYDGWYWGGYNDRTGSAWGAWGNGGCLNCHASADNPELTFSARGRIEKGDADDDTADAPDPPTSHVPQRKDHIAPPRRRARHDHPPPLPPDKAPAPEFLSRFPVPFRVGPAAGFALPDESLGDDFVSGAPPGGPDPFLTSFNCSRCHAADAPGLMMMPAPGKPDFLADVSPPAEWGVSLMGLAGRDPVFHAQLEGEKAEHPRLAAFLDDTCFRCHGVMGQRQLHLDRGERFTQSLLYAQGGDPRAKYGALARDGVSCTVCHGMAAAGLGQEQSFTGQFRIAPAGTLFGPYSDFVKALPMKQALGLVPQGGDHLRSSALCGSCHTVILPVADATSAIDDRSQASSLPQVHEQTTYLEWKSSIYQNERAPISPAARSCQDCHMPRLEGATRIANIEEYLPRIRHGLPREEIALSERRPFSRHTLAGANYFVLSMFDQFNQLLGIDKPPPDTSDRTLPALELGKQEMLRLAQQQSARVEFAEPPLRSSMGSSLEVRVRVTNLAGHKLPSGVGFRRAFLELTVSDGAGKLLWRSGGTDGSGAIVGRDGQPLPSEFTDDPDELQPHRQLITRPEQVQIYEERHADRQGRLTIGFLSLHRRVKDNRLLPRGFRPGRNDFLLPVGVGGDESYKDGSGGDEVRYRIPLEGALQKGPLQVQATLYYQSVPPYYLRQLFARASGKETRRLYYLASRLDVSPPSPIASWKLRLAQTARTAVP